MSNDIRLPKGNGLYPENAHKKGETGSGWGRALSRVSCLLALALGTFGGVGLEVCLTEEAWTRHLWVPSALIFVAVVLLASCILQSIRRRL